MGGEVEDYGENQAHHRVGQTSAAGGQQNSGQRVTCVHPAVTLIFYYFQSTTQHLLADGSKQYNKTMKQILGLLFLLTYSYSWCLHKTTAAAVNITEIDYSPDRSLFLTTNSLGVVHLWTATNALILTSITPASGLGSDAKFSKNNTIFGIITTTSTIYIYNSSSPYSLLATIAGSIGTGYTQIDFSFDGDYMLICGGSSNTAKVYSFATSTFTTSVSFSSAYTCKFAPDNKFAIAATTSSTLNYYLLDGTQVWSQSYNGCLDLDFDSTSATLVMSCNNGGSRNAYGMDIATQTATTIHTSTGNYRTAKITGDSTYAAFSGDEKILYIVNKTGTVYNLAYNFPLDSEAYSSDFSYDGNYLLVGTKAGYIYEYAKFCLDCAVGTYQNMTGLQCELCSEYNRACGACINSTYCIECVQGYYLQQITTAFTTTRVCLACLMEGCIVCNSSAVCLRCEVGYYVNSNMCKTCRSAIAGCLRCNSSSICQQCSHDYYLNSNSCTICTAITGCSLCTNSSYCNVCQVGYYFSSGTCNACPTNCLACFNTTTCQDCRQGYYPTNTAAAACSACPTTGCLSCNQTGYCYECATNRYFNSTTGTCPACTYPCSQCLGSVCYNCEIGYYLDFAALSFTSASQGGLCLQCPSPCLTCNSTTYCLSCPLGYYLVSATHTCQTCDNLQQFCSECSPTTCLNCTLGYYLNSSNLCTSCTVNMYGCLTCTSISNCLKCAPGFYLTTNTGASSCGSCNEGCELCNSTAYCFGCIDGFYLDTGTNTCKRCVPPCSICSNASVCLECEEQYYLSSGSCSECRNSVTNCIACDDETGVVKCSVCRNGYYANSGACTACTLPCLSCTSSTFCSLCQIGYFVSSNACTLCPENCTACTSATACSSCSIGFFLNTTDNKCYHCSVIGCLTCNVSQKCLSCSPGYYLTATWTCSLCSSSIKYCQTCSGGSLCSSCSFGYTMSSGNTSCVVCSSISGCFDCTSQSSCNVCENGYYWVNVSGNGACSACPFGCLTCSNSSFCDICLPGYVFNSNNMCTLCSGPLLGCHLCTTNSTCIECENGYYLASSTCSLCRSALKGCQYCNSSSVCTFCSYGYYLQPNNTCEICSTTMHGCQLCLSSTVCKSCAVGYYLSGGTCFLCGSAMSGCISCTDNNTCSECLEGYAINGTSIECVLCKTTMLGCIGCTSLSLCDQCQAGYYLRTADKQCVACTGSGCEVCYETNPVLCVSCNTMYFLSSSRCYYCHDYLQGCIECTSSSTCTFCQTGYFLNATNKCELCQFRLEGCGKCNNSSVCYQCKSTYFLNTTSNTCQTCLSAINGCAYCIDLSECTSCSNGYYKNSSSGYCDLCTNIDGCLACTDLNKCILCKGDYFLEVNQTLCYPCSAITGCYSCTNNLTCLVCKGGYILNDDKICQIFTVQADQPIKGMKMVSEYANEQQLTHTLLANQMKYKEGQFSLQKWRNTTDIILQHPDFVMENLTITDVKFTKSNELEFTTNNPLKINLNSLPARRLLYSMPEGYKTFLKMKQEMVNVILPDLYMSHSLVMDYDLSQPEFYTSIYSQKFSLFQSGIGIVIILVLAINYIIRAVVTCPNEAISQYGQILPHFSALKAPIFIIYPLFPEEISFCFGFMAAEFPWARQFFASALSDNSQTIPTQYSVIYKSLSFSSTYLLPFVLGCGVLILMWLYKKNSQQKQKAKDKDKELQNPQGQQMLPEWPVKMVMYNFFYFGLIFNSSVSLQNVLYNPLSQISVSAVFTVLGIVCFGLAITDCLYSLYQNPLYFFKLRILAKATLLSISHLSPIYLFSSSLALDFLCIVIQYRLTKEFKSHPKLWLYNNVVINLALALLIFIHSHFVTLILAGMLLSSIILIEFYVHYQDYVTEKKRKRFALPKEFKLENTGPEIGEDLNIWNIDFAKNMETKVQKPIGKNQLEGGKPEEKAGLRQGRRKKIRESALVINKKQESMQSIGNVDNENTFVAADLIN